MAQVQATRMKENNSMLNNDLDDAYDIINKVNHAATTGDDSLYDVKEVEIMLSSDNEEEEEDEEEEEESGPESQTTIPLSDSPFPGLSFDSIVASSVITRTISSSDAEEPTLQSASQPLNTVDLYPDISSDEDEDEDPSTPKQELSATESTADDDGYSVSSLSDVDDDKDIVLRNEEINVPTPPPTNTLKRKAEDDDNDKQVHTAKRIKPTTPYQRITIAKYVGAGLAGAVIGAAAMFAGLIAASEGME